MAPAWRPPKASHNLSHSPSYSSHPVSRNRDLLRSVKRCCAGLRDLPYSSLRRMSYVKSSSNSSFVLIIARICPL